MPCFNGNDFQEWVLDGKGGPLVFICLLQVLAKACCSCRKSVVVAREMYALQNGYITI